MRQLKNDDQVKSPIRQGILRLRLSLLGLVQCAVGEFLVKDRATLECWLDGDWRRGRLHLRSYPLSPVLVTGRKFLPIEGITPARLDQAYVGKRIPRFEEDSDEVLGPILNSGRVVFYLEGRPLSEGEQIFRWERRRWVAGHFNVRTAPLCPMHFPLECEATSPRRITPQMKLLRFE